MPRVLRYLLDNRESAAAQQLAAAAPAYLASPGLFADPHAAADGVAVARAFLDRFIKDVRRRGCTVVEVESEHVVLGLPADWDAVTEASLIEAAKVYLPEGVQVRFGPQHAALYARGPGTSITRAADGSITLVGAAFRAGRLERYGEAFIQRAADCVLRGDAPGLREAFLAEVHRLRTGRVPLDELCVQVTLHKSPAQYRRGGTHEEPYQVLLNAGVRAWRVGQRIRYFRARGGEPRLYQEADGLSAAEADAEHYVQRLCALYCQQFAQAYTREDFARIFRVPAGLGPYDEDLRPLAQISTIQTVLS